MKKLFLILISLVSLSIGLKAAEAGPHKDASQALTKTAADYGMEHLPGPLWRVVAAYLEYNGGKFFDLKEKQLKKAEVVPTASLGIDLRQFEPHIFTDFAKTIAWNTPTTRQFLQKYKTDNSRLDLTKHGKALCDYQKELNAFNIALRATAREDYHRRFNGPLHIPVDLDHILVIELADGTKIYQLLHNRDYKLQKKSDKWILNKSLDEIYQERTLKHGGIDDPEHNWGCTVHNEEHPSYELSTVQKEYHSPDRVHKGNPRHVMLKVREKAFDLIHQLFPVSSNAAAGKDERKDS